MKLTGPSKLCVECFPPIVSFPSIKHNVILLLPGATVTNAYRHFCVSKSKLTSNGGGCFVSGYQHCTANTTERGRVHNERLVVALWHVYECTELYTLFSN